eukprot:2347808-Rhodomonas_salina.1
MAAAGGAMPGAFGAPYIPGGRQQETPLKAPILTDDLTQFMSWQESFRLAIDRQGNNLVWTLMINDALRQQRVAALGLLPAQEYADQELMWAWLHEACKYSVKARTIIQHAMVNKGVPTFATEAWKAIVARFNPANPRNAAIREQELVKKINEFEGEWREWMQDVIHHFTLLIQAGMQKTENELIQLILKSVGTWALKNATLSSRGRCWESFLRVTVPAMIRPLQLRQLSLSAERAEDDLVFSGTWLPEPDADSTKFNNNTLAQAYASVIAREARGGDSTLPLLNNSHLRRIENGVKPVTEDMDFNDPIEKGLLQNQLNPSYMLRALATQVLGIGATNSSTTTAGPMAVQETPPTPTIPTTPAASQEHVVEVQAKPSNALNHFCGSCGAKNLNALADGGKSYACGRCGMENHTERECRIDAVRTRQEELQRNHLTDDEDERELAGSPYPGIKKTVKFKGQGGGGGRNQRDDRGRFARDNSQSPSRDRRRGSVGCFVCWQPHTAYNCPVGSTVRNIISSLIEDGAPITKESVTAMLPPSLKHQFSSQVSGSNLAMMLTNGALGNGSNHNGSQAAITNLPSFSFISVGEEPAEMNGTLEPADKDYARAELHGWKLTEHQKAAFNMAAGQYFKTSDGRHANDGSLTITFDDLEEGLDYPATPLMIKTFENLSLLDLEQPTTSQGCLTTLSSASDHPDPDQQSSSLRTLDVLSVLRADQDLDEKLHENSEVSTKVSSKMASKADDCDSPRFKPLVARPNTLCNQHIVPHCTRHAVRWEATDSTVPEFDGRVVSCCLAVPEAESDHQLETSSNLDSSGNTESPVCVVCDVREGERWNNMTLCEQILWDERIEEHNCCRKNKTEHASNESEDDGTDIDDAESVEESSNEFDTDLLCGPIACSDGHWFTKNNNTGIVVVSHETFQLFENVGLYVCPQQHNEGSSDVHIELIYGMVTLYIPNEQFEKWDHGDATSHKISIVASSYTKIIEIERNKNGGFGPEGSIETHTPLRYVASFLHERSNDD